MTTRRDRHVQYAALPYRRGVKGKVEIMLVTSRDSGRWIIPKGWPMENLPAHKAAAKEAVEEAGIVGKVRTKPIGRYRYAKRRGEASLNCEVTVFALEVLRQLAKWPEQHERRTQWFALMEAAKAVTEPELAKMIRNLAALIRSASAVTAPEN